VESNKPSPASELMPHSIRYLFAMSRISFSSPVRHPGASFANSPATLPSLSLRPDYTGSMPDLPSAPRQVGILVLDDDAQGRGVLRQVLDAEGWSVRILAEPRLMLSELATGDWALVIANLGILGLESPAFLTLRELALVPAEDGARLRVLFLLPETSAGAFAPLLDRDHLPYVVRPFHLHDLLEKVSDLLVEIKVIEAPIRQVRRELAELRRRKQKTGRPTSMFATRESYGYTEEELAEYERAEDEETRKKKSRKKLDLGDPYG